jgi:(+)-trans-carveol dehydrogenase
MHVLPVDSAEPVDISNAVLFLASDESRYITGLPVTLDAGSMLESA